MNTTVFRTSLGRAGLHRASLAAVVLIAASAAAVAAPRPQSAAPETINVTPVDSSVHDIAGQRYDVPSNLLRPDGTLINGLPPQPLQFG